MPVLFHLRNTRLFRLLFSICAISNMLVTFVHPTIWYRCVFISKTSPISCKCYILGISITTYPHTHTHAHWQSFNFYRLLFQIVYLMYHTLNQTFPCDSHYNLDFQYLLAWHTLTAYFCILTHIEICIDLKIKFYLRMKKVTLSPFRDPERFI